MASNVNSYATLTELKNILGITSTTDDTPILGDTCRGRDLGFKSHYGQILYLRVECPLCREHRWIIKSRYHEPCYCRKCFGFTTKGKNHKHWKQGRFISEFGYVMIRLYEDDFFYSMANNKHYVLEHRLVVAKALGRCLHRWEIVHHKHGFAKDDNRYPETLQLVTDDRHNQITIMERRITFLESRIIQLEAEMVLLRKAKDVLVS